MAQDWNGLVPIALIAKVSLWTEPSYTLLSGERYLRHCQRREGGVLFIQSR